MAETKSDDGDMELVDQKLEMKFEEVSKTQDTASMAADKNEEETVKWVIYVCSHTSTCITHV